MNSGAIEKFIDSIKEPEVETNRTNLAVVARVDGEGVVWVNLVGAEKETPTASTSTEVKSGDVVNVEWRNNKLYIAGNYSDPSAGVVRVANVEAAANTAKEAANNAVADAGRARDAAEQAEATAENVEGIAEQAKDSADSAYTSAVSASNSANMAFDHLSVVEDIVGVLDLLTKNGDYRRTTDQEPLQDKWYFTRTGSGTSADPYEYQVVNNPIFEYVLTSDTDIVQGKTYYTRTGAGTEADPYVYTQVENPVIADIGTYYEYTNWNYFELVGIDTAIQNYVSSHLALVGNTLKLQNGNTQIALSTTDGMTLFSGGSQIAQYGENAVLGNPNDFHVTIIPNHFVEVVEPTGNPSEQGWYELDGNEYVLTEDTTVETGKTYYEREVGRLSFWRGPENNAENEVAYVSGNKLYITQSVVLQQMDVGKKVADEGLGQWSWKVHEVNGENNLYLKWFG